MRIPELKRHIFLLWLIWLIIRQPVSLSLERKRRDSVCCNVEVVKLLLSKWQNQKATIGWRLLISASCYCVLSPDWCQQCRVHMIVMRRCCDNITTAPIIVPRFPIMRSINRVTSSTYPKLLWFLISVKRTNGIIKLDLYYRHWM